MSDQVMQFLTKAFSGAVSMIDRLVSSIPGAETAIVWGVFVTLATGFLIVPIRGYGHSDRARAGAAIRKRRSQSKSSDGD